MNIHTFCRLTLTTLIVGLSSTACYQEPDFSTTPSISFNSVTKFTLADTFSGPNGKKDSVIITIDFKDGDGDLGEPAPPDLGRNDPKYGDWGIYELKTFRKLPNGTFEEVILPENNKLFFPELLKGSKKNNRRSPIEGVLDYSTIFYYGKNKKMNVVKFKIRIRDRALNVSNVIESDTISIPLTI